jgi:hypothetical protein
MNDARSIPPVGPRHRAGWSPGVLLLCMAWTAASAHAEWLPVTLNTGAAVAVTCEQNLDFGTISIPHGNPPGSVSVAAASASGSAASFPVTGRQPALCTVTDVSAAQGATIVLSGGGGSFTQASGQLLGAMLTRTAPAGATLSVTLQLSAWAGVTTGAAQSVGTPIYIGGTLAIPSGFSAFGTYTESFTITVTE